MVGLGGIEYKVRTTSEIIQFHESGKELKVTVPENMLFTKRALQLGGHLTTQKDWVFDVREKELVTRACSEIFGATNGEEKEIIDVKIEVKKTVTGENRTPLYLFKKMLVYAREKKSIGPLRVEPVQAQGVIVVSGIGFEIKGTSDRWRHQVAAGTVLIVRDVVREYVEKEKRSLSEKIICKEIKSVDNFQKTCPA